MWSLLFIPLEGNERVLAGEKLDGSNGLILGDADFVGVTVGDGQGAEVALIQCGVIRMIELITNPEVLLNVLLLPAYGQV